MLHLEEGVFRLIGSDNVGLNVFCRGELSRISRIAYGITKGKDNRIRVIKRGFTCIERKLDLLDLFAECRGIPKCAGRSLIGIISHLNTVTVVAYLNEFKACAAHGCSSVSVIIARNSEIADGKLDSICRGGSGSISASAARAASAIIGRGGGIGSCSRCVCIVEGYLKLIIRIFRIRAPVILRGIPLKIITANGVLEVEDARSAALCGKLPFIVSSGIVKRSVICRHSKLLTRLRGEAVSIV